MYYLRPVLRSDHVISVIFVYPTDLGVYSNLCEMSDLALVSKCGPIQSGFFNLMYRPTISMGTVV